MQLIVNDGTLNSLPATTEIMAVAQATSLTQQIRNLQGLIRNLPPSAFRNVLAKDAMLIEFNAVLLTIRSTTFGGAAVASKRYSSSDQWVRHYRGA